MEGFQMCLTDEERRRFIALYDEETVRAWEYQVHKYHTKIENIQMNLYYIKQQENEMRIRMKAKNLFKRDKRKFAKQNREEKQKAILYRLEMDRHLRKNGFEYNCNISK